MGKIFRDNMGNLYIWKDETCKFEYKGMHHADSRCDGKAADIFIQFNTDLFLNDKFNESEIAELEGGFPIIKDLDQILS